MTSALQIFRSRSLLEPPGMVGTPSFGVGASSRAIEERLRSIRKLFSDPVSNLNRMKDSKPAEGRPRADQLLSKLNSIKSMTSAIGMYLDADWRRRLFARLDEMLQADDWEDQDEFPSEQSFSTFLRMIIYLHPTRRPGIGLSPAGHFLASWSHENGSRIVIECLANDEVRWVLSRTVDGEREAGAGEVQIHRIPDVIAGYEPEELFENGHKILA